MSNSRQYRYLHKGENEWLADGTNENDPEWQQAWGQLEQDNKNAGFHDMKVEFTEDMYVNDEYGETPEWVNVTLHDAGVLPFKMARGIVKSKAMEGLQDMCFTSFVSIDVSDDFGGWSYTRLQIYEGGAYVTFCAKHTNLEVEVNITEQFNQAIGEIA
jgi:hypothetical protein